MPEGEAVRAEKGVERAAHLGHVLFGAGIERALDGRLLGASTASEGSLQG